MKKVKTPVIPSKVRITAKVTYEVLFTDEFLAGPHLLGEMRPTEKQIVIKNGQSDTELAKTYIHELFHAISDENDIKLTEKQVRKLENAVYRFFRLNGIL